jgi:hypothetical protein
MFRYARRRSFSSQDKQEDVCQFVIVRRTELMIAPEAAHCGPLPGFRLVISIWKSVHWFAHKEAAMSLCNKSVTPPDGSSRQSYIARWRVMFASEPPLRIGTSLLIEMLAQAQRESTMASTMRSLEKQLAAATAPQTLNVRSTAKLRIGDRIVRGWGGTNHEVTILLKGFSYRGEIYKSLSEIARIITGARWSGPRFFGTREKGA